MLQTHNVRSHIKTYILLLLGVLIGITVTLLSQGDLRDYMTTAAGMSIETKHEVVKVVDKNVAKMLDNQRWIDRDSVLTVLNSHNTSLPVEIPTVARDKAHLFKYKLPIKYLTLVLKTLDTFHQVMTKANLSWHLAFGTALGSYRHHSIIPWDDDVDVDVPAALRDDVIAAFRSESFVNTSLWELDSRGQRHKFYSLTNTITNGKGTRVPYVDVFYYNENSTHIWGDMLPPSGIPKSVMFPLHDRPFSGRMFPGPRDPHSYLSTWLNFHLDECYTGDWNHMKEMYKPFSIQATVPCAGLVRNFTFVMHTRGPAGAWCREDLVLGTMVLATFVRDAHGIPVC